MSKRIVSSDRIESIQEYEEFLKDSESLYIRLNDNESLALLKQDVAKVNKAKKAGKLFVRHITYEDSMDVTIRFQ